MFCITKGRCSERIVEGHVAGRLWFWKSWGRGTRAELWRQMCRLWNDQNPFAFKPPRSESVPSIPGRRIDRKTDEAQDLLPSKSPSSTCVPMPARLWPSQLNSSKHPLDDENYREDCCDCTDQANHTRICMPLGSVMFFYGADYQTGPPSEQHSTYHHDQRQDHRLDHSITQNKCPIKPATKRKINPTARLDNFSEVDREAVGCKTIEDRPIVCSRWL